MEFLAGEHQLLICPWPKNNPCLLGNVILLDQACSFWWAAQGYMREEGDIHLASQINHDGQWSDRCPPHIQVSVMFKSFASESDTRQVENHWFTLTSTSGTIFGVNVTRKEKMSTKKKNILHKKGRRLWSPLQVGRRVGNTRTERRDYLAEEKISDPPTR